MTATGGYYLHKTIADVTTTHLAFPGGEQAHVFVSWLHPFKEQKLVVIGDRAMAVFDDGQAWEPQAAALPAPHRVARDAAGAAAGRGRCRCRSTRASRCSSNASISSIASRPAPRPRTDGREGLRVLRVLARASAALTGVGDPARRRRASTAVRSPACRSTNRPMSTSRARSAPAPASGTSSISCRAPGSAATARSVRT